MLDKLKQLIKPEQSSIAVLKRNGRLQYLRLERSGKSFMIADQGYTNWETINSALFKNSTGRDVTTAITGPGVRVSVVDVPVTADEDVMGWLAAHESVVFPKGLKMDDFIHDTQVTGRQDGSARVLFCSAWPDQVAAIRDRFAASNCVVDMLGARGTDLYGTFALYQDGFLDGNKAVVDYDGGTARVLICKDGQIAFEREIVRMPQRSDDTGPGFLDDIVYTLTGYWTGEERETPIISIYLTGTGNLDELEQMLKVHKCSAQKTEMTLEGQEIGPEWVHLLGLALKRFVPMVNAINLLPLKDRTDLAEKDRLDRFTVVWRAAAAVIAGLTLVTGLSWGGLALYGKRLDDKVTAHAGDIMSLETTISKTDRLKKQSEKLHALINKRTGNARVMERVSGLIPDNLWLNTWELEGGKLVLTGYARNGGDVSRLLENLEGTNGFENSKLVFTEKLGRDKVYRLSGRRRRQSVVSFKIETDCHGDTETQRDDE